MQGDSGFNLAEVEFSNFCLLLGSDSAKSHFSLNFQYNVQNATDHLVSSTTSNLKLYIYLFHTLRLLCVHIPSNTSTFKEILLALTATNLIVISKTALAVSLGASPLQH